MGWGLGSIVNSVFGSGGDDEQKTTSQSTSTAMARPGEYDDLWNIFLDKYLPNQIDETAYLEKYPDVARILSEQIDPFYSFMDKTAQGHWEKYGQYEGREATFTPSYEDLLNQAYTEQQENLDEYISDLTGLKEPYLSAVAEAMEKHSDTLDEIVTKRMAGEDVGPYASAIDKLLGERTNISFGGGDPTGFVTKGQASLLKDLLGAQETALTNIQGTSAKRAVADALPAEMRYNLEKEIADTKHSEFSPSSIGAISYLQDLISILQPMEALRYGATPSISSVGTFRDTKAAQADQTIGNLTSLVSLGKSLQGMGAQ